MTEWREWNNCTVFWWIAAFGLGLGAYTAVSGGVGMIIGILLGLAVTALIGLAGTRYFCVGASAGVNSGASFTTPAVGDGGKAMAVAPRPVNTDTLSVANAAAREAMANGPYYGPTSARAVGARPTVPAPAKATAPTPPKPAPKPKPAPAAKAAPDDEGDGKLEGTNEGTKPEALAAPRDGQADNLKEIKGIGPKLEQLCNSMGFYHFDQIAGWTADEVAWVDANLEGFKGRVSRDNWIAQAKILASGGETEFSKRVDEGDVY